MNNLFGKWKAKQSKLDYPLAMRKYFAIVSLFVPYSTASETQTGGRPNAFSQGNTAFAGIVNPANAVWVADRFDMGVFWVHQKSSITNFDNNPLFPPDKIDLAYKSRDLFTTDAAIQKQVKLNILSKSFDTSFGLATFTLPNYTKLHTKKPFPIAGTTPITLLNKTDAISAVFSLKLNTCHSIGLSIDYFYFSHRRNGYQNADHPLRSVSPGNVSNNGIDHSHGIGLGVGWRWKISKKLDFGVAWSRKKLLWKISKISRF